MGMWLSILMLAGAAAYADEPKRAELQELLEYFLSNVEERQAHERFWAEDLVYTSSSGLRFGKSTIMESYADTDDNGSVATEPDELSYRAEDVQIRLYGDTAIVAFKLVAEASDPAAEPPRYFLNTGTFVRRDGVWKAVAWQATKAAD
ncbi:MAG: nuclear transport factor 2 family protein [Pseudomonadota bacterium]